MRDSASADSFSSSAPVVVRPSVLIPSSRAMTLAVRGWSPVIMMGRMPARRARATASLASARGGSMMPISPANTRSCSTRSSGRAECSAKASCVSHRPATPSVLSASPARTSLVSSMAARRSGVSGRRSSPTSSRVHRVSRTSGAPFVNTTPRPGARHHGAACSSTCVLKRMGPLRRGESLR